MPASREHRRTRSGRGRTGSGGTERVLTTASKSLTDRLTAATIAPYAAGGYPILPVVLGARSTRRRIVAYLGVTLLATVALATSSNLGGGIATVAVLAVIAVQAAVTLA